MRDNMFILHMAFLAESLKVGMEFQYCQLFEQVENWLFAVRAVWDQRIF